MLHRERNVIRSSSHHIISSWNGDDTPVAFFVYKYHAKSLISLYQQLPHAQLKVSIPRSVICSFAGALRGEFMLLLSFRTPSNNSPFLKRTSAVDAKPANANPCLDDYDFLRTLGTGANATVYLVREKHTSHLYALKAVDKYTQAGRKVACSMVFNEQAALTKLSGNDFILPLHACFHDTEYYYLVTVRAEAFQLTLLLIVEIGLPPWR